VTEDPEGFIARNLPVLQVRGLPAIRLHMGAPNSGVWRLASDGAPPYWPWCWAGGLALAHHVAARPGTVRGKRVFDLGTGSGLVAIAAARAGAESVVACDADANAAMAARLNAGLNGVAVEVIAADPLEGPTPEADVVLGGDVFYSPALAERVVPFLARCRAAGVEVLVGDPGRDSLSRGALELVAEYAVPDFGDPPNAPLRVAGVYRFVG